MWFDIAKTLFKYYTQHKEQEQQVKDRLSGIFENMSELLEETAKDLNAGTYPHGKCAAMEVLAIELTSKLIGKMEPNSLDSLHAMLFKASKLEKEYADRENPETIGELLVASGKLRALSMIVKL